jgi:hypothetical protein
MVQMLLFAGDAVLMMELSGWCRIYRCIYHNLKHYNAEPICSGYIFLNDLCYSQLLCSGGGETLVPWCLFYT